MVGVVGFGPHGIVQDAEAVLVDLVEADAVGVDGLHDGKGQIGQLGAAGVLGGSLGELGGCIGGALHLDARQDGIHVFLDCIDVLCTELPGDGKVGGGAIAVGQVRGGLRLPR